MAYKQYLLLLSLCALGLRGMEVARTETFKPSNCAGMRLLHENRRFYTEMNGIKQQIQPAFVDKKIRNIDSNLLSKMTTAGCYLKLNRFDGTKPEYSLNLATRGPGGGPWLGAITFLTGTAITTAATVGVVASCLAHGNVPGAAFGGVTCAQSGMALTAKATVAATAPTP